MGALWPDVKFSVGIHPHKAGDFAGRLDEARACLIDGIAAEGGRAIGEIGLDYHYDFSPRDTQQDVFVPRSRSPSSEALPIIIHTREACDDTFASS